MEKGILDISELTVCGGFQEVVNKNHGFNKWILNPFNISLLVEPIRYNKKKVCQATGMSYSELNQFLSSHNFDANEKFLEYSAIEALEKWYLKKLKRYVKNGLFEEDGTEAKVVFLKFCNKYRRKGHKDVKSWKDIDEDSVLQDFLNQCMGVLPFETLSNGKQSLFACIYSTYLFHTRFRLVRHFSIFLSIITFLISHRYHIFTTDSDSNSDATVEFDNPMLNLPQSLVPYGLASLAKP